MGARRRASAWIAPALLLLGACEGPAPATPETTPPEPTPRAAPATGAPAIAPPSTAVGSAPIEPGASGASRRFLGPDPSLLLLALDAEGHPLALPDERNEVDRTHETWLALGPLGEVVARAEVVGMERYEPYEGFVQREPIWSIGRERIVPASDTQAYGVALFAAADGPPPSPPTAGWSPDATEQRAAEATLEALARAISPTYEPPAACLARTRSELACVSLAPHWLFFRAELRDDTDHDGTDDVRTTGFALGGGRDLLAVLAEDAQGRFAVDGLRIEPNEHGASTPVGAIDLDGDGFPEVVLRVTDLADFGYVVLRRVGPGRWETIATGSPGSTA